MKILVLNWQDIRHPLGGGAEIHLHGLFEPIARAGHEVTLLSCSFKGAKPVETVNGIRVIRKGGRYLFNFRLFFEYLKLIRRESFDVVVDDLNKIPFFTPLFVKLPLVCIVHHFFDRSIFKEIFFPLALYVYLAEKLVPFIYRHSRFVLYSPSTAQELMEKGIAASQLEKVEICINQTVFRMTGEPKSPAPLIGYFGRLKKYKSIDHLLHAFVIVKKEIDDAKLVIIGEGDARSGLQDLAARLGIGGDVSFTGFLTEEEIVRIIQQTHLIANTSSKEGWGLTVFEANACGVPVVASDVPGLRDSVRDGETGLLYEYGDIEQLAEKILLLMRDDRLRDRLAEHARAYATRFTWETSAQKMIQVLEKEVKRRGDIKGKASSSGSPRTTAG